MCSPMQELFNAENVLSMITLTPNTYIQLHINIVYTIQSYPYTISNARIVRKSTVIIYMKKCPLDATKNSIT
jgi:hypothetical protein